MSLRLNQKEPTELESSKAHLSNDFVKIMLNPYLAGLVLDHISGSKEMFNLLNVSRVLRYNLLKFFFEFYRSISILRDSFDTHYPTAHRALNDIGAEKLKKEMIETGQWPKKKYFDRFNDFNFEELVISKVMRIPYWFAPTVDLDHWDRMDDIGIYLTSLSLDGTAVTGRGLFGCVNMHTSMDVYRTSAGLLSFIAPHLEYLSIMYCKNIQHSDIAIYLMLPPADHVNFGQLTTLRVYGCGEAPTEGPFQNIPGYGSKNRITEKADNILNMRILSLLYTLQVPFDHHERISVPLSLRMGNSYELNERRERLDDLQKAGWLDASTLQIFPPPVYLTNRKSLKQVKGPWGGFLGTMHESLVLKSVCLLKGIHIDWEICVMGSRCASYKVTGLAPVAIVNDRTQRVVGIGNYSGAIAGINPKREQYLQMENGVVPRIPVALSLQIPGKEAMYQPQAIAKRLKKQPAQSRDKYRARSRPEFLSLRGPQPGPDYDDPHATGDQVVQIEGLSGEGMHSHSAACFKMRQENKGKPCANCGLWETDHYIYINKKGVEIKNPGRKRWIGEMCEICVPFYTCGDCGDFYCPSCTASPSPGDLPNPWAAVRPSPSLIVKICDIHGSVCQSCFEASQSACTGCGKYICKECISDNIADSGWQMCSSCGDYACEDCVEQEIMTCPETAYLEEGHKFCLTCLGGMCRFCEEIWCAICHEAKQDKFMEDHQVKMSKDAKYGCCTCQNCFEKQLAWAKTELQRVEVWRYVGVNILEREQGAVKQQERLYSRLSMGQHAYSMPSGLVTPKDDDMKMTDSDLAENMAEDNSESDGASSIKSADISTGAEHPLLQKMDEVYKLLLKELKSGGVVPPGVSELLSSVRKTRHHVLKRKTAIAEHRKMRMQELVPSKRLKDTRDSNDPACSYCPSSFGATPHHHSGMSTPLPNLKSTSFRWIPARDDLHYYTDKTNDPSSDYYLDDNGLSQLNFIDDEWEKENEKRKELKRQRVLQKAKKIGKKTPWIQTFLPGIEKSKIDRTSVKRKREVPLEDSETLFYISDNEDSGIQEGKGDRSETEQTSQQLGSEESLQDLGEAIHSVRHSLKRLRIAESDNIPHNGETLSGTQPRLLKPVGLKWRATHEPTRISSTGDKGIPQSNMVDVGKLVDLEKPSPR